MSEAAYVDCFLCQATGYAPPGITAGPRGACPECFAYRERGYPPGKKPVSHKELDPPTDFERRARAMAHYVYDAQTFQPVTRPRRRTRHRYSWPDLPRLTTEFPPQAPLVGRWNHFRQQALAIKRPGDIKRHRRPIGNYTREVLQNLTPAEIPAWLSGHRKMRDLRHQAKELEVRLAREDHERELREAQQAKLMFYGLCGVAILVLIAGILTINLVVNR